MNLTVSLRGEAGVVEILVHGYEREEFSNSSDADWVSCTVNIRVGGFSCALSAAFGASDFREFSTALKGTVQGSGTATFSPLEQQLVIEVHPSRTGSFVVKGSARQWDPS